jgi:hypothetical protein
VTEIYYRLCEGQRFRIKDRTCTLVEKKMDFRDPLSAYPEIFFTVKYDDNGETEMVDAGRLYKGMIYNPLREFEVGDTFEVAREGLEPNLRGVLVEVDPEADRWPYRLAGPDGAGTWFAWNELTKIHSVVSRERAPRAAELLRKQIAAKKEELEALETALEVLEYASA